MTLFTDISKGLVQGLSKAGGSREYMAGIIEGSDNVPNKFKESIEEGVKASGDLKDFITGQYGDKTKPEDITGPANETGFETTSVGGKLSQIMSESGFDPNSDEMKELSNYTTNGLNKVNTGKLGEQTGFNDLTKQYSSASEDYFKTISELPGYSQIRKKYMDDVNTQDIDFAINQISKNKDSSYSMIMAEAYKRGDVINPYNIQQQADKLQSMYNNQINSLIETKQNRLTEAKDMAKLDYEDIMNRVKLGSDMLDRVKGMKEDAYKQIRDGVTDAKWITELDNLEKRSTRDYKVRIAELKQKTGVGQAELLFKMKEYENKYGETLDPTQKQFYLNQYVNNKVTLLDSALQGKEDIASVVNTMQTNSRGYNTYKDAGGIVAVSDYSGVNELLGKKGGTVSWRTNNPGNIIWSGNTETAKWLGAVGVYENYNNMKSNGTPWSYLVFENPEKGAEAMGKLLLYGKSYLGKTVEERLKTWQGGSSSAIGVLSKTNPGLLKKSGNFTPSELNQISNTIRQSESWKVGTALEIGSQKDYFTQLKNDISVMAQQYYDKGYPMSQANSYLKQAYGKEANSTIIESLNSVYETKQGNKSFEGITKDFVTPGLYENDSGKLKENEFMKDITASGEYKDVEPTELIDKVSGRIINDYVNDSESAIQVVLKLQKLNPNANDFYIPQLKTVLSEDELLTAIKKDKGFYDKYAGKSKLIATLISEGVKDKEYWKTFLKEKYGDGFWVSGFGEDEGEKIYNKALKLIK